jgi:hypothetical protein
MTLHEADKTVQRYAVPDVLEPDLDAALVAWESITPEGRYGPTRLITGDTQLLVTHEPFALTMTVRGKEVLVLNDRQLLHMEHQHATRQVDLPLDFASVYACSSPSAVARTDAQGCDGSSSFTPLHSRAALSVCAWVSSRN